jgi:acyl-CoA thioesterase-1
MFFMRRIVVSIILLSLSVVPAAAGAAVILVVGDSLSAAYGLAREDGWVALMEQRLIRDGGNHTVVNASISGDTTAGGAARLPAALERHRPDVVILALGGNDGLRGLPPAAMRANLERMAGAARDAGARVILAGVRMPTNYGPAYQRMFEAVFAEVAGATGAALVPNLLADVDDDRSLLQDDGIHPTAAAQPRILDNVLPVLKDTIADSAGSEAASG